MLVSLIVWKLKGSGASGSIWLPWNAWEDARARRAVGCLHREARGGRGGGRSRLHARAVPSVAHQPPLPSASCPRLHPSAHGGALETTVSSRFLPASFLYWTVESAFMDVLFRNSTPIWSVTAAGVCTHGKCTLNTLQGFLVVFFKTTPKNLHNLPVWTQHKKAFKTSFLLFSLLFQH